MENHHLYIVKCPMKNGWIFHSYVSLPEGNQHSPTNQHRPTTKLPGGSSRTATWTSGTPMSRNGSDDARRWRPGGPGGVSKVQRRGGYITMENHHF